MAITGVFYVGSTKLFAGTGSPEGVVTANVGDVWARTDGLAGTTIYTKASGTGNTGWVAPGVVTAPPVTLTDAQIKALPTTPITLVAAPGAGRRVALVHAALRLDAAAGAYTNIDATFAALFLNYAGDTSQWASLGVVDDTSASLGRLTSFFAAATQRADLTPYQDVFTNGWAVPNLQSTANSENKALVISADNSGSGDFTGGNAANSLSIVVTYTIV